MLYSFRTTRHLNKYLLFARVCRRIRGVYVKASSYIKWLNFRCHGIISWSLKMWCTFITRQSQWDAIFVCVLCTNKNIHTVLRNVFARRKEYTHKKKMQIKTICFACEINARALFACHWVRIYAAPAVDALNENRCNFICLFFFCCCFS